MRSIPSRLLCVLALTLSAVATTTYAADFAYVLSRGTTPVLRGYKIAADGMISSVISTTFPVSTADNSPSERRVMAYASREKVLLVGLIDKLMVYRVEQSGLLTPSSTPSIDFSGNRIGAVEVVEVGSKTFVYVGDGLAPSPGIYGYRILADGSVTGIAGFPVVTQNPITGLASNGSRLFSAQPSNNFVYMHTIAADGTLGSLGSARPQSRCSQIKMSPSGTTLIANADDLSFVQLFEYFKKDNSSLEFAGLTPMQATYDEPTVISVGKKFVAVARRAADVYGDVRLVGLDGAGRMRVLSEYSSTSGMTQIDSIALIQNDALLLAISDTNDALKSFATEKKAGTIFTTALDSEAIPGLADVTTMLAIKR